MHLKGIKVPPKSRAVIRKAACAVYREFCPSGGAVNGGKLLEQLVEYGIAYDVVPDSIVLEMGGVEASFNPATMTLFLTETTYKRLARGDGRALFTLSHELGHTFLHAGLAVLHRELKGGAVHKVYEDSEWQANVFAAEFCMPLPEIQAKHLSTADAIQRHFGVSFSAAQVRAEQLQKEGLMPKDPHECGNTRMGFRGGNDKA